MIEHIQYGVHAIMFDVCAQPRATIHPCRKTTSCSMRLSELCSPAHLCSTLRLWPSRAFLSPTCTTCPWQQQQQPWSTLTRPNTREHIPCSIPAWQTLWNDWKKCSPWGRVNAGKTAHDVKVFCFCETVHFLTTSCWLLILTEHSAVMFKYNPVRVNALKLCSYFLLKLFKDVLIKMFF